MCQNPVKIFYYENRKIICKEKEERKKKKLWLLDKILIFNTLDKTSSKYKIEKSKFIFVYNTNLVYTIWFWIRDCPVLRLYRFEIVPFWDGTVWDGTVLRWYRLRWYRFESASFWKCTVLRLYRFEIVPFWDGTVLRWYRFKMVPFWECIVLRVYRFEIVPFWDCTVLTIQHNST